MSNTVKDKLQNFVWEKMHGRKDITLESIMGEVQQLAEALLGLGKTDTLHLTLKDDETMLCSISYEIKF